MAKVFHTEEPAKVNQINGYWTLNNTYILITLHGLVVGTYCDNYLSLNFVYQGFRYRLSYEQVKTQKHAAVLTKRFYYEVINNA